MLLAVSLPVLLGCATASPPASGEAAAPAAGESTAKAADPCDWESLVLPGDRAAVQATFADAARRIPSAGAMPGYHGDDLREASLGGIVLAHQLLQRAQQPLPLGEVTGAWQVRSIQASGTSVFDYPFFRARIERDGCRFGFAKTTGSQRRSGQLLPMSDARALAFLGTGTVNDDPPGTYGAAMRPLGEAVGGDASVPVNSAGKLVRIGQRELLMLLDMDERGFELYHLKR